MLLRRIQYIKAAGRFLRSHSKPAVEARFLIFVKNR